MHEEVQHKNYFNRLMLHDKAGRKRLFPEYSLEAEIFQAYESTLIFSSSHYKHTQKHPKPITCVQKHFFNIFN